MVKAVFLDMDDTLIVNQVLYTEAEKKLALYLEPYGVKASETREAIADIDKANFPAYGYSRQRFPATFEQTLKRFIPNADAEMVKEVRDYAEEIFNTVAAVKPGVLEAMELLTQSYPVYIVTAGPDDVQNFRIDHLPFKDKLSGTYVVPKKDKAVFERILKELDLKPEDVVMVGDSLRSDVIPAVEAGMKAIWIEATNSVHETADSGLPAKNAHKFDNFLNAARHIVTHDAAIPHSKPAAPKNGAGPKLG